MKKLTTICFASTLVIASLSGCAPKENASSSSAPAASAAATTAPADNGKKVTLTVSHFMVEKPKVETFKKLTESFTKANPNIAFDIQVQPVDKFAESMKMKIAAGDAPDIIFGRPAGMVEFTKAGNLLDITNEPFTKKIDEKFIPNVSYEGKVYGLPIDLMTNGVIYNKDIFKQNGIEIPKTYSDLVKASETLKAKGIPAFAASWKDGHLT